MTFFPVVEASGESFRRRRMHQIRWMLMRASLMYVLIVVSGLMAYAHTSLGQILDQRVNVGMDNEPMNILFQRLEKQTGVSFAFSIDNHKQISFPRADRTLKETLDLALSDSNYTYEVIHNTIAIVELTTSRHRDTSAEIASRSRPPSPISGKVVDAITREPLPGVNVVIKGTTRGTSTDNDGRYTIDMESDETLIFSFIGYKPVTIEIGSLAIIDVSLEQDVAQLSEVVVNGGYYETTDKLKTGSIVKVTSKDIERQPVTSPLLALQGRVPGVEISPSSGAPGVAPKIRIRGTNSLRQTGYGGVQPDEDGNYPLYVIDGIPLNPVPLRSYTSSESVTAGGYDPLSTINTSNIESIEILKDGDATAMYGSRGANGVILITTKRNKSTERTNFDLTVYHGIGRVSKRLKVLGLNDYLSMRKESLSNNGLQVGQTGQRINDYDLMDWDTTRNTDWQKMLIGGNAHIADIQSSISAGTKNTSFRFGGGYHKETLVFPGNFGYYKVSGQLTVNHVSENQRFKISFSNTYGLDNSRFFYGDLVSAALTLPPNAPSVYNADGSLNWELHDRGSGRMGSTWINPISLLQKVQSVNTRNNISNIGLSYKLASDLHLSVSAGYTDISNRELSKSPRTSFSPTDITTASASFNDSRRSSWIIEPKISYSNKINDHRIEVVAGGTLQRSTSAVYTATGTQYASDALLGSLKGARVITIIRDDISEYKYASAYARLGYNWKERYIFNVTGRRDGSSRFGPGNRFGNFGSVGAAWIFTSEDFISENLPFLNFGKIRGSYGITGSDNIGDYNFYNLYEVTSRKYGGVNGVIPYALYNPDYAWEVTKKIEGAIELSFADNRINFEVDWYRNRSSNQLVNYPLPDVAGFPSVLSNFNAVIQNSGLETVLRADLLNSNSWRWTASVNFSLPHNKLVRFDGIENSPYASIYKVGDPLSVRSLYTWTGVNKETGIHSFFDKNGDGAINDFDRSVQNIFGSNYYGGFSNVIQFKNFEISFLFQFSHQRGSQYLPGMPGTPGLNQPVDVLSRWRNPGDGGNIQKFGLIYVDGVLQDSFNYYRLLSTSNYNFTDASFLRLKTFSLTYSLRDKLVDKIKLQGLKIFLQGQNLLTFTRYKGLDPETGTGLPPLRIVTIGIQSRI
jgi:TonB-linked SusC/RagA family outer membrane protein